MKLKSSIIIIFLFIGCKPNSLVIINKIVFDESNHPIMVLKFQNLTKDTLLLPKHLGLYPKGRMFGSNVIELYKKTGKILDTLKEEDIDLSYTFYPLEEYLKENPFSFKLAPLEIYEHKTNLVQLYELKKGQYLLKTCLINSYNGNYDLPDTCINTKFKLKEDLFIRRKDLKRW